MSQERINALEEFVSYYRQMDDIAQAIESRKASLRDAREATFKTRMLSDDNVIVKTIISFISFLEEEIQQLEEYIVTISDLANCNGITEVIPIQYRYDVALTFILEEYAAGMHESIADAVAIWQSILASPNISEDTLHKINESKVAAQMRENIVVPLRQEKGDINIERYMYVHSEQEIIEKVTEEKFSLKKLFSQERYLSNK